MAEWTSVADEFPPAPGRYLVADEFTGRISVSTYWQAPYRDFDGFRDKGRHTLDAVP